MRTIAATDEFGRLTEAASSKVSSAVERLHAASATRWSKVYTGLAK